MNAEIFEKLIQSPESKVLDFKECGYDFSGNKETEDAKLVKDVLSFSNTVREESAYIIIGIKEGFGGKKLCGITHFPDDATLQQKVKDKIYPCPKFKSYTFKFNDITFGVIEIPVEAYLEPLASTTKLKGIEPGKIYLRRGSTNAEATGREVIEVSKWLESLQIKKTSSGLLSDQLTQAMASLANTAVPLSTSLSMCIGLAINLRHQDFEEFCYHELTGYDKPFDEYGETAEHRIMNVVATPLSVERNPNFSLTSDALLNHMLTMEHFAEERFFFNKSINEIEGAISWLKIKNDKALAAYEIDDKIMYPDSQRVDGKVTLYMGMTMFNNMYEKVRKIALKHLLDIQRQKPSN